jgi:hypothetical protein
LPPTPANVAKIATKTAYLGLPAGFKTTVL